jgi:glycolate oxidase iron-sulfur subunit
LCAVLSAGGGQVPGTTVCGPAPEADLCCGGAGLYSLLEPVISAQLGERKADLLAAEGVRWVVTSDPGCRLQLQGRLARRGVAMVHAAELCDQYWQGGQIR